MTDTELIHEFTVDGRRFRCEPPAQVETDDNPRSPVASGRFLVGIRVEGRWVGNGLGATREAALEQAKSILAWECDQAHYLSARVREVTT